MGMLAAVARNTLAEIARQPIYALLLVLMCMLIIISPAFAAHIYTFGAGSGLQRPAERLVADLGLATILLTGLLLAVFTTTGVIHREIEERTAVTVLVKRVGRAAFVFGKYLGVAAALAMATLTGAAAVLLTVRMGAAVAVGDPLDYGVMAGLVVAALGAVLFATFRNYYRGRAWIGSFAMAYMALMAFVFLVFLLIDRDYGLVFMPPSKVDSGETRLRSYDWDVLLAALLVCEAVLVLASIAAAASTRLAAGANFAVCAMAFLGGLSSDFIRSQADAAGGALAVAGRVWHALMPNLQVYWMSDALTREQPIPWCYLRTASSYSLLYIMVMLLAGAVLFQRREIV